MITPTASYARMESMIKVAVLWLVNEEQEVLLAQRAPTKRQDPGVWGPSVTGKLEPGESSEQALLREAEEELALKPAQYTPQYALTVDFAHPDGETRQFNVYIAHVPRDIIDKLKIREQEVAAIKWLLLAEAKSLLLTAPETLVPSARAVWPATFEAMQ